MKVLGVFVANGFTSEARVAATLMGRREGRYDVKMLHHVWPGDQESASLFEKMSGAEVERLDFGWRPNPGNRRLMAKLGSWRDLHVLLPRLILRARAARPDVIYSSQQTWDCYAAMCLSKALRVPHVVHLHYTIGPWLGRIALRRLARCARVIGVSEYIRGLALAHGIDPSRAFALRNSITPTAPATVEARARARREFGIADEERVVGIVSRLDPYKGHSDVLRAFAKAQAQAPRSRLLVVGQGPLRAELEEEARKLGVDARVVFTGGRRDVPALLGAMDVFIHPSKSDPCPMAVLEASAAGLPVVAYAEGGIPELVSSGETGLLFPSDDVAQLGDGLTRLLRDPDRSCEMGRAGRERIARDFQPAAAATRFVELLKGAVCAADRQVS